MADVPPAPRVAPPPALWIAGTPDLSVVRLPAVLTPFVGRKTEAAAVRSLLTRDEVRLLTLTGPGGVGKTRLAIRAAEGLGAAFADGVAFVPLAPVDDPDSVASTIFAALDGREAGHHFSPARLRRLLDDRAIVLLLDNFEHLLSATPTVVDLLASCRRLKVLVTSRAVLRLSGEHAYPVAPLSLPEPSAGSSPATAMEADSVRLFVQRARASRPAFELTPENAPAVAALCQRLEGLPLAIELAAARIGHLSPAAMVDRLGRGPARRFPLLTGGPRDLPPRHQTMRDAVAWSYDLLDDGQRTRFRHLAVFAGGFTLAAAAAVCRADEWDILDGIGALVGKSLVRDEREPTGEPRYGMLETIREFGLERLAASGDEQAVRQRHADWYRAFANRAAAGAADADRGARRARLEQEYPNLRSALGWLADQADGSGLASLAGSLCSFWEDRCSYGEGRRWLETALALGGQAPAADRLRLLTGAGTMAWYQADFTQATRWHEQALALARELGERDAEAFALNNLGTQAMEVGDYPRAMALFDESLTLSRATGNPRSTLFALHNVAQIERLRGAAGEAVPRLDETIRLTRELGESALLPSGLTAMGHSLFDLGQPGRAIVFFRDALELGSTQENLGHLIDALEGLARVASAADQAARAGRIFGAAAALRDATETPFSPSDIAYFEPSLRTLREESGIEASMAAFAAGRALSREAAIAEALAVTPEPPAGPVAVPTEPAASRHGLTKREIEVLSLLAAGESNRQIADHLFISPSTVARHLANVYAKLGVDSRAQATAWVLRHGLA